MPEPKTNESEQEFVGRCIRFLRKEEPELNNKQRVGKCFGLYRNKKGKK